jgi:CheY-like chemotaxis protein
MSELKRILLAEDDPRDVELILAALAEQNLANGVQVVEDGVQALDYLHRRGAFASRPEGDPVAVLLDLKMPRVDGLQVLTEMKADPRLRTVPIVMLTSSRESIDLEQCSRQGANAYVVKPVQFDEFMTAVKELGLFWAVVNEPPPGSVQSSGR